MQNRNYRAIGCSLLWGTAFLAFSGFMAYTTIEAGKEVNENPCHPTEAGGESCSVFTAWGYVVCDGLFSILSGIGGGTLIASAAREMGFFAANPHAQRLEQNEEQEMEDAYRIEEDREGEVAEEEDEENSRRCCFR
jgi:hypothetical protein